MAIHRRTQKGYLLIEALLGLTLLSIVVVTGVSLIQFMQTRSKYTKTGFTANVLLQEGMEVAYNLISNDISAYASGFYHPDTDLSNPSFPKWKLSGGSEVVSGTFTRIVELADVCRDSQKNQVDCTQSGATVDSDSRKVAVTVTWSEGEVAQPPLKSELLVVVLAGN